MSITIELQLLPRLAGIFLLLFMTILVPVVIAIPPTVLNVTASPPVINRTQSLNITANITVNVSSARVNITLPNSTILVLNMTNQSSLFNATFATLSAYPAGVYNVTIIANNTANEINNTERTNFTVMGTANLTLALNQTNYLQGTSLTPAQFPYFGIKVFIPYQARLIDSSTGAAISGATCNVTANNSGSLTTLQFNSTQQNYTGSLDTVKEYGETRFMAACSSPFVINSTASATANISLQGYITATNLKSFGSVSNNLRTADVWLSKIPSAGAVLNTSFDVDLAILDTEIGEDAEIFDIFFCGSNTQINCSFLKDFVISGNTTLRANISASLNESCMPKLCLGVSSSNLERNFEICAQAGNATTEPRLFEQSIPLNGTTIGQGDFLSMVIKCDPHTNATEAPESTIIYLYYNNSGLPNVHIPRPETRELLSKNIRSDQVLDSFVVVAGQNADVTINHVIELNSTLNQSRFLKYQKALPTLAEFGLTLVKNATYVYNSTGDLWASDNVSAGAPRTIIIEDRDHLTFDTETLPALGIKNKTILVTHNDAIRSNNTLAENTSSRKAWKVEIKSIFTGDIHIENVTGLVNLTGSGIDSPGDFDFSANVTNSSGTFDITGSIVVDASARTVTFPKQKLSNITFAVLAVEKPKASAPADTGSGSGGGGGGAARVQSIKGFDEVVPGRPAVTVISRQDIAVKEIIVDVTSPASGVRIIVVPLAVQQAERKAAEKSGEVYQYLEINATNLSDQNTESVRISFNVTKAWLAERNATKDAIYLYRYSGYWQKLDTRTVSEDGDEVEYESRSPGFSVFAIAAESPDIFQIPPDEMKPVEEEDEPEILVPAAIITCAAAYLYYAIMQKHSIDTVRRRHSRKFRSKRKK